MAKKQYFLIVDVETTIKGKVADFGAVLTDRKGSVLKTCAVLTVEYFLTQELFYDHTRGKDSIWSKMSLEKRHNNYKQHIKAGTRIIASTHKINRWLEKINAKYEPEITAYNFAFDFHKCADSGIDLTIFKDSFCLWHLASWKYAKTRKYLNFILANHLFNPPTRLGNMTYKTDAETMTKFVTGNFIPEPHTGLEDIIGYELPILTKIVNTKKWREKIKKYDWQNFQVKNHFTAYNKNVTLTNDMLKDD